MDLILRGDNMPLGIVSDEVFEAEFKNIERGRGPTKEVPEVIREIIAEDAILGDGSIEEVAEKHGVSPSSVSAYKHGATSTATYNERNERLSKRNDKIRSEVISTARSRLLEALSEITPDKLKDAKVRDIASVAKDMSTIIHNTEPQVSNTNIGAQFVFHVPRQKQESDFEVIDVGGQ